MLLAWCTYQLLANCDRDRPDVGKLLTNWIDAINQASSLIVEDHQMTVNATYLIFNRAPAMESSRSAQLQKQASTLGVFKTSAPQLTFVSVTHPDEIKD